MRFTKSFSFLVCSSMALPVLAQTTNAPASPTQKDVPLTLEETIRIALEHNLGLQIAYLSPAILEYNLRASYGYYDPTWTSQVSRNNSTRESGGFNLVTGLPFPPTRSEVDSLTTSINGTAPFGMRYTLSGSAGNTTTPGRAATLEPDPANPTNLVFTPHPGTDTTDASAAIRVTQPLLRDFWIDSGRLAIKLNKKNLQISDLGIKLRIMNLITTVENAYYDLVYAMEAVNVGEVDLRVNERLLQENRRKVEVGSLAPLEEKRAQAAVARSRTALVDRRNQVGSAQTLLRSLLTENYSEHLYEGVKPTDKLVALPAVLNLQSSLNEAMANRPDLKQEQLNLEKQDIQLKYDFNQLFPRLDVFATWGVNGLDPNFGNTLRDLERRDFQQDAYGVILSFPLTSVRERNNYKASKLIKTEAVLRVKQLEENIIKEVDDAIREVRTAYERVGLTRDTVAFAEAEFEAEQKRLEAGVGTSFFVLEAASRLTTARFEEIAALRDYNKALAELSFREATTLERRKMLLQSE